MFHFPGMVPQTRNSGDDLLSRTENSFLPAGTELHHGDGREDPALYGRAAALSGGRSGRAQLLEEAVQRDGRTAEGGQ